ncbi:MAG: AAA family ATPase [Sulfurimonas sp.]|nr:AAA family ATPase [Sulfurimonas sp.]
MNRSILIKTVRVNSFRGLKNIEIELEQTTVLTGMNNAGKTSFLKALQIVFGQRQFLSQDDFYIENNSVNNKITIDTLIVPIDKDENREKEFLDDWMILFGESKIKFDDLGNSYIPLRTVCVMDEVTNTIKTKQYILERWVDFAFGDEAKRYWYELDYDANKNISFKFDEMPFFYMDAKRDILEDIKLKSSYMGKMLSNIEYAEEDIKEIEDKIEELNKTAVEKSDILNILKNSLEELNSAMDSRDGGVELSPFTKKIRDLNKGLNINYGDGNDSFLMEYHGMGTRSWSSLLTLKAFIEVFRLNSNKKDKVFFPIVAIEEPESHLHPNAQKKLYSQINSIVGQKIISTHSPYVASMANLKELRNFYKKDNVEVGQLDIASFDTEDIRKIERQVINTRGEILFSKCIVLFEGETEEQALPIFFEKYFGTNPIEYGVDFIGVGGYGNYLPFIRFAEHFNIQWFIFSDNDKNNTVKNSVEKQFETSKSTKEQSRHIVFLDETFDFEKQLIHDGFQDEIKEYLVSTKLYSNEQHREAQEPKDTQEIYGFSDDVLYKELTKIKAQYAPIIAKKINNSEKTLPPKVVELFDNIANTFDTRVEL